MAKSTRKMVYDNKYMKEHARKYAMTVYTSKDSDIIEKMESVPSRNGYLKALVRADIEKENKLKE